MDKTVKETHLGIQTYGLNTDLFTHHNGLSMAHITPQYSFTPQPHRHNFYELFILENGNGTHLLDFCSHTLSNDQLYCIRPTQLHEIKKTDHLEGYFIMFEQDFLITPTIQLNPSQLNCFQSINLTQQPYTLTPLLKTLTKSLYQTLKTQDTNLDQTRALLLAILQTVEQQAQSHSHKTETTTLSKQFNQLLDQVNPPLTKVSDYAKKLAIHETYLTNTVKKETGKTAGFWIRQARLTEAKRLLVNESQTINNIATHLNFTDASYFCRFFKKLTGKTPLQWRNEN